MYRFTGKNSELKKLDYSIFRKYGISYSRKFENYRGQYEAYMKMAGGMIIHFPQLYINQHDTVFEFILSNKDKDADFWGPQDKDKAYDGCTYVLTKDNEILNRQELLKRGQKSVLDKFPDKDVPHDVLQDLGEIHADNMIEVRFLPCLVNNIIELDNISPLERV